MNTNKRFWCLDEYKGETSPIVDGKFAPTNEWLCNKLNELHDENQQLKKEYNSLQRTAYKIDAIAHEDREYSERLYKQNQQLEKENKELKDKNSQLQETLAFRSNQLALMERLVDDLGSEEMTRQMEEILND